MFNKKLIEGFHSKGFLMTYVAIGIIAIVATFVYGPSLKISADVSSATTTCTGPTSADIVGTCIESQPVQGGGTTQITYSPLCASGTSQRSWCNQSTGKCVKVTANCSTGTCNGNYCSGSVTAGSTTSASGSVDCCGNGKCDEVTTAQVGSCRAESASTCPADCSNVGTPPTPPAPVRPTVVTPPVPPGPTSTSVTPPVPPGPQTDTPAPQTSTPTPTTATPTPEPTVSAYITDTPTPGPTATTNVTETPTATPNPTVTAYTTMTAVKTAPPVIQITATPVIVPISAPSSPATEYIVSGITSGIPFALTIIVVILIGGVIIFRIITKKD